MRLLCYGVQVLREDMIDPVTGEPWVHCHTILRCEGGAQHVYCGPIAAARAEAIIDLLGETIVSRGVEIVVSKRVGRGGFVYHDIRLAPPAKE